MALPVLECRGTPREIGEQTGEAFRQEIRHNLETAGARPGPEWERRKPVLIGVIRDEIPDVHEEILGVPCGADLLEDDVFRFNVTSLYPHALDGQGCTNAEGVAIGHSSVGSVFQQSDRHMPIRAWSYAMLRLSRTVGEFVELAL